jgi:LmbE family N-acetylglucosaminyl deacetylase
MDPFQPLLATTVMVVAHPDDEVIAFGALMQRMKKAVVVFCTDGAPREQGFWQPYGSREAYAEVRRQEARRALAIVGAEPVFLSDQVENGIVDQELFRRLPEAASALDQVIAGIAPDCLLTLAYEGGHPDHDSCCFLASQVGRKRKIPVWESPLYHRNADGSGAVQRFPQRTGQEIDLKVEGEPLQKKVEMFHTYKSQNLVLDGFHPEIEQFRPVFAYDFRRRPFAWKLNYEVWQWRMSGEEVSAEFASYLRKNC